MSKAITLLTASRQTRASLDAADAGFAGAEPLKAARHQFHQSCIKQINLQV